MNATSDPASSGSPTRRTILVAASTLPLVQLTACGDSGDPATPISERIVSDEQLDRLAGRRIYFGHQSVGYDIVQGIGDILAARGDHGIRIVESKDPGAFEAPVFAHSAIGANEKPLTKVAEFSSFVRERLHGAVDVAFFKFCYADVRSETDVDKLFEAYRDSMGALSEAFPAVHLVHVTTPLTVIQSGPKAWLKQFVGRPDLHALANVRRAQLNALIFEAFQGQPVFDLAHWESTWESGEARSFDHEGRTFRSLVDDYSYDGKHLNQRGRRWIAAHLLAFLSRL